MALIDPDQIMTSNALRQKQTAQLAGTLARIPPVEPFVVAADLNLVPLHRGYRPLAGVARDTWIEAGWGFGFTWPNPGRWAFRIPPSPGSATCGTVRTCDHSSSGSFPPTPAAITTACWPSTC